MWRRSAWIVSRLTDYRKKYQNKVCTKCAIFLQFATKKTYLAWSRNGKKSSRKKKRNWDDLGLLWKNERIYSIFVYNWNGWIFIHSIFSCVKKKRDKTDPWNSFFEWRFSLFFHLLCSSDMLHNTIYFISMPPYRHRAAATKKWYMSFRTDSDFSAFFVLFYISYSFWPYKSKSK